MKHPYYDWYASDFLGSPFVQSLSLIEECCYRRLLDIQATDPDRRISTDMNTLRAQCKNLSLGQWARIWDRLKSKFRPHPDGAGGLVNPRLHEIIIERDEYLAERSAAGKNGAKSRWGHKQNLDTANSSAIDTANDKPHGKTIASTSNKEEPPIVPQKTQRARKAKSSGLLNYSPEFEEFWTEYPRKIGKADVWAIWQVINPSEKLRAKIKATLTWQKESRDWKKDGGQYIPMPATWLNQGRWDDQPDNHHENDGMDGLRDFARG